MCGLLLLVLLLVLVLLALFDRLIVRVLRRLSVVHIDRTDHILQLTDALGDIRQVT